MVDGEGRNIIVLVGRWVGEKDNNCIGGGMGGEKDNCIGGGMWERYLLYKLIRS